MRSQERPVDLMRPLVRRCNMKGLRHMTASLHGTVMCSVVTSNYLHFALALVKSVRRIHSSLPIVVCVADRVERLPELRDENTQFVFGDELGIPQWPRFSFQYTAFELACALKPTIMNYCFSQLDAERVVYLDSDIQLYGPLWEIADARPPYSVMLTPHLLSPLPEDGRYPSIESITRAGVYNGGFVSVSGRPSGREFLRWWESLMSKNCVVRPQDGLFVDQRPLDLVPGLFDDVRVFRRPGFHLAYWNMYEEQLSSVAGSYHLLNGEELTLFHFSGIDPDASGTLSKHQDRLSLDDFPVVDSLVKRYIDRLDTCGRAHFEDMPYGHGSFTCGTLIQDKWREAIRLDHPAFNGIENPFDTVASPELIRRFRRVDSQITLSQMTRVRSASKRVETALKWMLGRRHEAA